MLVFIAATESHGSLGTCAVAPLEQSQACPGPSEADTWYGALREAFLRDPTQQGRNGPFGSDRMLTWVSGAMLASRALRAALNCSCGVRVVTQAALSCH